MKLGMHDYGREILGQAAAALKDNRLRTVLSILGIAIGITAVMAVGTVSKGGHHLIFSELETFGLRSIWVFRDLEDKSPQRARRKGSGIENVDYAALAAGCCPAVLRATPIVQDPRAPYAIRVGARFSRARVEGVSENYIAINNDTVAAGRGLRADDVDGARRVAVIGTDVQADLFGARDAVGHELSISEEKFRVVGVLQAKDRGFLASIGSSGGENANDRLLIPYTTYQQMRGNKQIDWLQAETRGLEYTDAAVAQITTLLVRRHRDFKYRSITMAQYIATANRILQGVSLIGVIAASVSLLVGGMGIMNIMSTSVLERTREIGLRKALGARRGDILAQFLLEAMLISTIGGIAGVALGVLASAALAAFTGFPLVPSWPILALAFMVSIGVGLVSGYYPAHRAARLHPVIALRHE